MLLLALLRCRLNNVGPSCPLHVSGGPELQKLALSSGQKGFNSNKSLIWNIFDLACTVHMWYVTSLNMTDFTYNC